MLPIGNLCVMSKIKGRKIVCYSCWCGIVCIGKGAKERSFGGVGGFAGAQGGGFLCLMRCGLFCARTCARYATRGKHHRQKCRKEAEERERGLQGITGRRNWLGSIFPRATQHTQRRREVNQKMYLFFQFFQPFCASITRIINHFKSYKRERRRWPC